MRFAALLLISGPTLAPSLHQPGYASAYAPGVFENVVRVRFDNNWWRTPPPADWYTVAGYAATTDCDQVGRIIHLRPIGSHTWHRILIADCVGDQQTLDWMLQNSITVELDHNLHTRWARQYGRPLRIEIQGYPARSFRASLPPTGVAATSPHLLLTSRPNLLTSCFRYATPAGPQNHPIRTI